MGADCIIGGIRPQIAQTIIPLEINKAGDYRGDTGRRFRRNCCRLLTQTT
jgi:hypothetical protein